MEEWMVTRLATDALRPSLLLPPSSSSSLSSSADLSLLALQVLSFVRLTVRS